MKSTISVIIPVYNAEQYIEECIESILTQDYKDLDIILVNDGSTDASLTICNRLATQDTRIRIINKINEGVSIARNKGIEASKGEWITFVDADDYLLPGAISTLYNKAISEKTNLILANSLVLKDSKLFPKYTFKDEKVSNNIIEIKHFALWGYLFKADVIKKNNLRFIEHLAYSEDRLFMYQSAKYFTEIAYSTTQVYVYRINPSSVCKSKDGVRKAYHHFKAAYHLKELANEYTSDSGIYKSLLKRVKEIKDMGIYQFASLPFTHKELKEVKESYLNFATDNKQIQLSFIISFVYNYLLAKRRKMITFRKTKF